MHNTYIVSGLVDGAVAQKQAERRAKDKLWPESTRLHHHKFGAPCDERCVTIEKEEPNGSHSGN